MGHTKTVSIFGSVVVATLLAFSLALPTFAAASTGYSSYVIDRLCERQREVGSRLFRAIIAPSLCNTTPPPHEEEPEVTLTANPTTITAGGSTTLSWSSSNATSCTAFLGWTGSKSLSGSQVVSPTQTTTYQLDCSGPGGVGSDDATVTVTVAPPTQGTLRVVKVVTNDNQGTKTASNFSFQVNGGSAVAFEADGQNDIAINPGTHSVVEVADAGYATSYNNCSNVTVSAGNITTCTITNNDIAQGPTTGHLIVDKVTLPSGDTTQFAITATGNGTITGGGAGTTTDANSRDYEVAPGTYSVSEVVPNGWTQVSNTCSNVAVAAGETKTCVITNSKLPKLTVTKVVVNNNSGTKQVADFPLFVAGIGVTSGVENTFPVGTHAITESNAAGYTATFSGNCNSQGSITLAPGDVKTCTITNDDTAPETGTFTIRKVVIRDNGGSAATTSFSYQINGGTATAFEADGENQVTVPVGTHTVTEVAATGYTTTYSNCASVTVSNGETEICTITNNDVAQTPQPTLSFSANPTTVNEGSQSSATTTLTWDSSNATSCTASNVSGWSGSKALDGSAVVTPTATSSYVLTCAGDGGTVQATTTVTFVPVTPTGNLLITEVMYDLTNSTSSPKGLESANEWVEIFNGTNQPLDLGNYAIGDASSTDALPSVMLPAGKYAFITSSSTTAGFWTIPGDAVIIVLTSNIGSNGLGNAGDLVELFLDESSVDKVSWGTNTSAFSPSVPDVTENSGHSIARTSPTTDTGTAADWFDNASPSPGQ